MSISSAASYYDHRGVRAIAQLHKCHDLIIKKTILPFADWGLAPWVQRLIGANRECYAHEYSSVNPRSRLMEMKSINLTFCSFVSMKEQMSYFPHPKDPSSKTLMRQEMIVTVQGVPLTR